MRPCVWAEIGEVEVAPVAPKIGIFKSIRLQMSVKKYCMIWHLLSVFFVAWRVRGSILMSVEVMLRVR